MHRDHKIFIQAIKSQKKVLITQLNDTGRNSRTNVCRPLFYIPANSQDGSAHYYFWDGKRGEEGIILRVASAHISSIESTEEPFDPTGFTLMSNEAPVRKVLRSPDSLEHLK